MLDGGNKVNEFQVANYQSPFKKVTSVTKVPTGSTVQDVVNGAAIRPEMREHLAVRISIGSSTSEVPEFAWGMVKPKDGTIVEVYPRVQGPIVGSILMALVGAAAPVIAAAVFPALGAIGLAVATAAITVVGMLAVRALIPTPSQNAISASSASAATAATSIQTADDPVFSLSGSSNSAEPYQPYPTVLGRHIMFPRKTATGYTETVGGEIYLRERMTFGHGPVSISDLKIGTTPIHEFDGVEVEFLNVDQAASEAAMAGLTNGAINVVGWRQGEEAMTLYTNDIAEDSYAVLLAYNDSAVRQTRLETRGAQVDFGFQGLVEYEDDGSKSSRSVTIRVHYRKVGVSEWTFHQDKVCSNNSSAFKRFTSYINFPEAGQYDIHIRRITADSNDSLIRDEAQLTSIRSIQSGTLPSHAHISEIAVRIKASNELNGKLDSLNAVVHQMAPVWDGNSWSSPTQVRHPAWIYARALMGPMLRDPVSDTRIDLDALKAWADDEPHWTCDNVITGTTRLADVLDLVCACGRARRGFVDLKHSMIRDGGAGGIVQHFTPRNSWNFQGRKFLDRAIHAFRLRIISERKSWSQDEVMVYADGYDASNATEIETMSLPGVVLTLDDDNEGNAWRLGRYHLAVATLRPEEYTFYSDLDHLRCQMGDKVRVVHDVPLFGVGAALIGDLTSDTITLDSIIELSGSNYRFRVRRSDGQEVTFAVTHTGDGVWSAPEASITEIAVGDLVMVEETETVPVDLLIKGIQHQGDLKAKITALPAAPAVLQAESGTLPEYDPQITDLLIYGPALPIVTGTRSGYDTALRQRDGVLSPRIGVSIGVVSASAASATRLQLRWRRVESETWETGEVTDWADEIFTHVLENEDDYFVSVRSFDGETRTQGWVEIGQVTASAYDHILAVPNSWQASVGVDTVTLFGESLGLSDVMEYRIYAATNDSLNLTLVGQTVTTQFMYRPDAADGYTRYKVVAVNHSGVEGNYTGFIAGVPTGVTASVLTSEVTGLIDNAAQSALSDRLAAEAAAVAAAASEAASEAAETAAEAAEALAEIAKNDAETAATLAGGHSANASSAQDLAEDARDDAQTARTGAQDAETNAETAESGSQVAQSLAEAAQSGAETAEQSAQSSETLSAAYAAASLEGALTDTPAILVAPNDLWTAASSASAYAKSAIGPSTGFFVEDDTDLGRCLEFADTDNRTIGPRYPMPFRNDGYYVLTVRFKVHQDDVDEDTGAAVGLTTYLDGVRKDSNRQLVLPARNEADGVVTHRLLYGPTDHADISHDDWFDTSTFLDANEVFFHLRQNPSNATDGIIRIAEISLEDVTSTVEAQISASASAVSETAAAASEIAAGASASTALQAVTDAQTAEGGAATSAAAASTSENNAATSATEAAASEAEAQTAQTASDLAASNAASSETSAALSETSAGTSAAQASTSATNAAGSATESGNSANAAANSASTATSEASDAEQSATAAATSATEAATDAGAAGVSAGNAATSESNAAGSEAAAATSEALTAEALSQAKTAATGNLVIDPQFNEGTDHWIGANGSQRTIETHGQSEPVEPLAVRVTDDDGTFGTFSFPYVQGNFANRYIRFQFKARANVAMTDFRAGLVGRDANGFFTTANSIHEVVPITTTFQEFDVVVQWDTRDTESVGLRWVTVNASANDWFEVTDILVTDVTEAHEAELAATAAAASEASAAASETASGASASAADTSSIDAATSASGAATSAGEAASSETAAATSETNSAGSEAAASTSEANAATSENDASGSAIAAANSASTAASEATDAATSATVAQTAQTAAETAEAGASVSEGNAATSETNAAGSEAAAAASEAITATAVDHAVSVATGNLVVGHDFEGGLGYWEGIFGAALSLETHGQPEPANPVAIRFTDDDANSGIRPATRIRGNFSGRTLRMRCTARADTASHDLRVGVSGRDAAGLLTASSYVFKLLSISDTFAEYDVNVEFPLEDTYEIELRWAGVGGTANHWLEVTDIHVEDVTETLAAEAEATASANSATTAAASATAAGQSASAADTSEINAETSAGQASASETAAAVSEDNSESSATAAAASATLASSAQTAAETAEAGAAASEAAASVSEGEAASSATDAASSEAAAATSESIVAAAEVQRVYSEQNGRNAGFEVEAAGTLGAPAGWGVGHGKTNAISGEFLTYRNPYGSSPFESSSAWGANSTNAGPWWYVSKVFEITPSEDIHVTCWAYMAGVNDQATSTMGQDPLWCDEDDMFIHYRWYDEDGALISEDATPSLSNQIWTATNATPATGWHEYDQGEVTPPATAKYVEVRLVAADGIGLTDGSDGVQSTPLYDYETWAIGNAYVRFDDVTFSSDTGQMVETTFAELQGVASSAEAAISKTDAAASVVNAQVAEASAQSYSEVSARLLGGGVSAYPTFAAWDGTGAPDTLNMVSGEGTYALNTAGAKYGKALDMATAAAPTEVRPYFVLESNVAPNVEVLATTTNRVKVRAELELISGDWGAGTIAMQWRGNSNYTVHTGFADLDLPVTVGAIQTIEFMVDRPDNYTSGTNDTVRLVFYSTSNGSNIDNPAVSGFEPTNIRIHFIDFEAVRAEATASITQDVKVGLNNIQQAVVGMRAVAGTAGAELELVAVDDPGGNGASVARLKADNILLDGSVKAKHIEANSITAEKIDATDLEVTGDMIVSGATMRSAFYTKWSSTGPTNYADNYDSNTDGYDADYIRPLMIFKPEPYQFGPDGAVLNPIEMQLRFDALGKVAGTFDIGLGVYNSATDTVYLQRSFNMGENNVSVTANQETRVDIYAIDAETGSQEFDIGALAAIDDLRFVLFYHCDGACEFQVESFNMKLSQLNR